MPSQSEKHNLKKTYSSNQACSKEHSALSIIPEISSNLAKSILFLPSEDTNKPSSDSNDKKLESKSGNNKNSKSPVKKKKPLIKKPSISEMYLEAFDLFDADGSGRISKDELFSIVQKLDLGIDSKELDRIINEVDANHDGEIDRGEFLRIMKTQDAHQLNQEYRETFDKFDLNGDGVIELHELRQVMKMISSDIPDEEIKEMFADADAENNGVISFDEFVHMMEQSKAGCEDESELDKSATLESRDLCDSKCAIQNGQDHRNVNGNEFQKQPLAYSVSAPCQPGYFPQMTHIPPTYHPNYQPQMNPTYYHPNMVPQQTVPLNLPPTTTDQPGNPDQNNNGQNSTHHINIFNNSFNPHQMGFMHPQMNPSAGYPGQPIMYNPGIYHPGHQQLPATYQTGDPRQMPNLMYSYQPAMIPGPSSASNLPTESGINESSSSREPVQSQQVSKDSIIYKSNPLVSNSKGNSSEKGSEDEVSK